MTSRLGIVGTSAWAANVHGPAAAAHPDWELTAVWGRSADKAAALGSTLGCAGATDFPSFLDSVDAVVFAVPPDVQAPLAIQAAKAGKHLLLEKPVALDAAQADQLVAAVGKAGVAGLVFFTRLWTPQSVAWLEDLRVTGGWESGHYDQVVALPGDLLAASPWRAERGALWDVGPHALSSLERVLGPVTAVSATAGVRDLVHLSFTHAESVTSTAALCLTAVPEAVQNGATFWGTAGSSLPLEGPFQPVDAAAAALTELHVQAVSGARPHPADVSYGAHVVHVLAAAQSSLATGAREQVPPFALA